MSAAIEIPLDLPGRDRAVPPPSCWPSRPGFDGANSTVEGLFVAPCDLLRWAHRVRPHVEKIAANSGGRYEAADVFAALASGRMLLWVAIEGVNLRCVLIGEVQVFPRLRALRLVGLCGHRPRRWRHLLSGVEEHARRVLGCDVVEAVHPPRILPTAARLPNDTLV